MRITVFTPTYNRGYIIENLYRSLQRQTFLDFEWVVIDDGSTDNTASLFAQWCCDDNPFPICYHQVENGGKHRAINRGVQLAQGELFFIVDSDDYLTDDALECIARVEDSIPTSEKAGFCGVCGLKGRVDGTVGTTYSSNSYLDITALEREKNGISGDKAEVFYTKTLANYPFPEFEGERFITECTVWDKMAYDGLKLRFFNETIYVCDYLQDGLTSQGYKLYAKNPRGWGLYIFQSIQYGKLAGKQINETYLTFYYEVKKENRFSLSQIADCLHCKTASLFFLVMKDMLIRKPVAKAKSFVRCLFGGKMYQKLKELVRKGE